jgi:glycosyltransferase involved in cell wall biosynthesis
MNLSQSLELPRTVYTVYLPYTLRSLPPPKRDQPRSLLFCGRIDGGKGLLELINALGVLAERGVTVRLRVAGDGPARPQAEQRALRLGLADAVTWLGRIPMERVYEEMSVTLAVVVPSITNDPSPFTVLEAGGCRVPVIGSCKGGIPEEIGEGGWIIDPENAETFADTIQQAWASPDECQRRGARLHEHVAAYFDPVRSFHALCALMERKPQAAAFGAIAHEGRW